MRKVFCSFHVIFPMEYTMSHTKWSLVYDFTDKGKSNHTKQVNTFLAGYNNDSLYESDAGGISATWVQCYNRQTATFVMSILRAKHTHLRSWQIRLR